MSRPAPLPLQFDQIVPCTCRQHSVVRLFDARRVTRVQVRVSATCAEAITAGEEGRESLPSSLVDALVGCMEAGGTVPVELILSQPSGEAVLHLRTESGGQDVFMAVEPGLGVLIAHRLRLAIVLSRARAADAAAGAGDALDPLAAFRGLIEALPWLPGDAAHDERA